MFIFLQAQDAKELATIHHSSFVGNDIWTEDFFVKQLQSSAMGLAYSVDKKIISFILFQQAADIVDILTFATLPNCRRQGHAKNILQTLVNLLPKDNKLFLEVNENNAPAIKLYQDAGFAKVSLRKNYYAKNQAAQVWRLEKK